VTGELCTQRTTKEEHDLGQFNHYCYSPVSIFARRPVCRQSAGTNAGDVVMRAKIKGISTELDPLRMGVVPL
jgi:hypothetical protein